MTYEVSSLNLFSGTEVFYLSDNSYEIIVGVLEAGKFPQNYVEIPSNYFTLSASFKH